MACFTQLLWTIAFVLLVHVFLLFILFRYGDYSTPSMDSPTAQAAANDFVDEKIRGELSTEEPLTSPLPEVFCEDSLCSNFLTNLDKEIFCGLRRKYLQMKEPPCKFADGVGRKVVALVSFPGSGNTWVRSMLQEATGVCTGSVYCDHSLKMNGFPGESVVSPSVLVVKTHESPPAKVFDAAIVIMRNPFHALVAERARRAKGHVNEASQIHYSRRVCMCAWTNESLEVTYM